MLAPLFFAPLGENLPLTASHAGSAGQRPIVLIGAGA